MKVVHRDISLDFKFHLLPKKMVLQKIASIALIALTTSCQLFENCSGMAENQTISSTVVLNASSTTKNESTDSVSETIDFTDFSTLLSESSELLNSTDPYNSTVVLNPSLVETDFVSETILDHTEFITLLSNISDTENVSKSYNSTAKNWSTPSTLKTSSTASQQFNLTTLLRKSDTTKQQGTAWTMSTTGTWNKSPTDRHSSISTTLNRTPITRQSDSQVTNLPSTNKKSMYENTKTVFEYLRSSRYYRSSSRPDLLHFTPTTHPANSSKTNIQNKSTSSTGRENWTWGSSTIKSRNNRRTSFQPNFGEIMSSTRKTHFGRKSTVEEPVSKVQSSTASYKNSVEPIWSEKPLWDGYPSLNFSENYFTKFMKKDFNLMRKSMTKQYEQNMKRLNETQENLKNAGTSLESMCFLKLICGIGFNNTRYGDFGDDVIYFLVYLYPLMETPPSTSAIPQFDKAFHLGQSVNSTKICATYFPTCKTTNRKLTEFALSI